MSKQRISLTLEEDLVDRIDQEAERDSLNRSQKIQNILDSYFESKGLKNAVILCGDPELKSLDLYKGRSVLTHIIEHLSDQGIRRAVLLTGQNRERIEKEFGNEYENVNLDYVEEDSPRGTAAALQEVEAELGDESFVVLNGHVITDVDLDEMLRTHREQNSMATIALTTVEDPSKYGVARLKGQQILGFEEKPSSDEAPSRLINAGTYVFEPEIFQKLEENDLEPVFDKLASDKQLSGYIYGGEWIDIGDR
jgi:NDP-sugar pyrophosphorylase family protein